MRSLALQRYSAFAAITALAAAAVHAANTGLDQHIRLAWTLTRILLQL